MRTVGVGKKTGGMAAAEAQEPEVEGTAVFWDAPEEVWVVFREVLSRWHQALLPFPKRLVMTEEIRKAGHGFVMADVRLVGGLQAYLMSGERRSGDAPAPRTMVVRVVRAVWDELDHAGRLALLDHECCHVRVDELPSGEQRLVMVAHDLEEFRAVIERHGAWDAGIRSFLDAGKRSQQLTLDWSVPAADGAADGGG